MLLALIVTAAYGLPKQQNYQGSPGMAAVYPGLKMTFSGVSNKDININKKPIRLYVKGNGKVQSGAQIIVTLSGLKPNTRVYWSYVYTPAYEEPGQTASLHFNPFSSCSGFTLSKKDDSTTADEKGETRVRFTSSTYAGDSFRIGACFHSLGSSEERFAAAAVTSGPLVTWKRLYLEQPKVLKNVRFPNSTWKWVRSNLETLNIELIIEEKNNPAELDPVRCRTADYFSGPKDGDLRYGPRLNADMNLMLWHISERSGDDRPETINVVILGAVSQDHDLIKNSPLPTTQPPQPVNYDYSYKRRDVNPSEFLSNGTAVALLGDYPSIFIWSDYWWIFSRVVKVDHDKTLARAILHELGHHLLKPVKGKTGKILDNQNHLSKKITIQRSIMNGYRLMQVDRSRKPTFHPESIRRERRFIKNPTWHPQVERLIRRFYIPLKQ